jgi:hypothetical protein
MRETKDNAQPRERGSAQLKWERDLKAKGVLQCGSAKRSTRRAIAFSAIASGIWS